MDKKALAGSGYGVDVDMWSLGCTIYCMLIGSNPFQDCTDFDILCGLWRLRRSSSHSRISHYQFAESAKLGTLPFHLTFIYHQKLNPSLVLFSVPIPEPGFLHPLPWNIHGSDDGSPPIILPCSPASTRKQKPDIGQSEKWDERR